MDIAVSPLGQRFDRCNSGPLKELNDSRLAKLMRFRDGSRITAEVAPLGMKVDDWKDYGFELNPVTCELSYVSVISLNKNSNKIDRQCTKSVGFIQAHTCILRGPVIETIDRSILDMEKLRLFTIELRFQSDDSIHPRYCILGHSDEQERERWFSAINLIIERKAELDRGWKNFASARIKGEKERAEQWVRTRAGEIGIHVNERAKRKARLQNGKVLHDLPIVFERFSEECPCWPRPAGSEDEAIPRVMDVADVVEALSHLGLELSPKLAGRLRDELRSSPACLELPSKLDCRRFELVFHSCRREMLVAPSAELRQSLLRIMRESSNPFLQLLSPAERTLLLDGRDAAGVNACICRTYARGAVLVRQDDPGDSMFIVIDGRLSVVVAHGAGALAAQREVAQLGAGSVMGEMSLVLGRPRSATCVVASDAAAVAEVARSAVFRLLDARPRLARELEELVHRRDAANFLALGRAGAARAALAAQEERSGAAARPPGLEPRAMGGGARSASPAGRAARRITRRSALGGARVAGRPAPSRPATAAAAAAAAMAAADGRPLSAAAAAVAAGGGLGRRRLPRMAGRWVKGSGAHILVPHAQHVPS